MNTFINTAKQHKIAVTDYHLKFYSPFYAFKAVLLTCQACETQDIGMHMGFGTGMG